MYFKLGLMGEGGPGQAVTHFHFNCLFYFLYFVIKYILILSLKLMYFSSRINLLKLVHNLFLYNYIIFDKCKPQIKPCIFKEGNLICFEDNLYKFIKSAALFSHFLSALNSL